MSIAANIIEGRGQKTDREFARFLRIALNSTSELEYHLITARDMGVTSEELVANSWHLVVLSCSSHELGDYVKLRTTRCQPVAESHQPRASLRRVGPGAVRLAANGS